MNDAGGEEWWRPTDPLPAITLRRKDRPDGAVFYVAEITIDGSTLSVCSQSPSSALLRAALRWHVQEDE